MNPHNIARQLANDSETFEAAIPYELAGGVQVFECGPVPFLDQEWRLINRGEKFDWFSMVGGIRLLRHGLLSKLQPAHAPGQLELI
jgi:hypothetical protein